MSLLKGILLLSIFALGSVYARPGPVLVLGDSLAAEYGISRGSGWVSLLERRMREAGLQQPVINASVSGETTSGGRARLPDLLQRHRPGTVIIELGGNDALRGLPLTLVEKNLRDMVRLAREQGAAPVLVGMMMPPNYGRAYSEQFSDLFRRIAESEGIAWVPFLLEGIAERLDYFLPDRIHPAESAQPILLETVWPVISRVLSPSTRVTPAPVRVPRAQTKQ